MDALNVEDLSFGLPRLQQAVILHHELDPRRLGEEIRREIHTFVVEQDQFDDITYLVVRFDGTPGQGPSPEAGVS